ncbi:RNA polymerase sigma factor SigJ [Sphingomonas tabacisoli]|uniref:RNA polymerase sigma factor SigJ n=1 Tax=Sphingomonas tabacisoli TaxID=2249466 RepID=A0ABW4I2S6_9SPHN
MAADPFTSTEPRLRALAYRMLGSHADAADAVQDTATKWLSTDRSIIENPEAWLVRTCTRASIDLLRRRKREAYVGPWLPEPSTEDAGDLPALAESVRLAFLLMLERLSPAERAALLLHDVFDEDYSAIASAIGSSEAMARQHVSRARRRIAEDRARFAVAPHAERDLMERFGAAVAAGDLAGLTALFAPDAELRSDGGGKRAAALNVITGADRIARFFLGITRKHPYQLRPAIINGALGGLQIEQGEISGALSFATDGDRITGVFFQRNPDKLARVH